MPRTQTSNLLMDLEKLKKIMDWVAQSPVVEFEIIDGDFEVHLRKAASGSAVPAAPELANEAKDPGHQILAASYGVIHLSPAPNAPPFVTEGQAVTVGQSLCTIEAMKVFSPVEADRAGVVRAVLVSDGAEVSAGQPLFRID